MGLRHGDRRLGGCVTVKAATRLLRAIDELKESAGERKWVLVIETAHPKAPGTRVRVRQGLMANWEVLGLLHHGLLLLEADYKDGDAEEVP